MVALAACGSGGGTRLTHHVAVDWEGTLDGGLFGPHDCHPERASGDVLERANDRWRAARPGVSVVPCRDGTIKVVARRASLRIDVPTTLRVGERANARLVGAASDGEELMISPHIEWQLTGAIDRPRREGCMDWMFEGTFATAQAFQGREPGVGTVRARVAGRVYERIVDVAP